MFLAGDHDESHVDEQRDAGTAILLISEDLDEISQVADRIMVMYEGRIMGIMEAGSASIEEIGLMMAGQNFEEAKESVS